MLLTSSNKTSLKSRNIDFKNIALAANTHSVTIVMELLPSGHQHGAEWVSRNPTRPDNKPGSFSVNLHSGKWADFATGDYGGDLISLTAYIKGIRQTDAAIYICKLLDLGEICHD